MSVPAQLVPYVAMDRIRPQTKNENKKNKIEISSIMMKKQKKKLWSESYMK